MSPRFFALFGMVLGLSVLTACDSEEAPKPAPLQPVRAEILSQDTSGANVRYSANIEANTQVNVAFKVTGYVTALMQVKDGDGKERVVQAGDIVKKGDILATVDSKDIRDSLSQADSQVAAAQANLNKGKQDYDRATTLFKSGSMTAPDYDSAKQEYENAVAQMENAKAAQKIARNNVNDFDLAAPLDGVVLQRNLDVGSLANPQTVAFVIADTTMVKAVFGVPDNTVQSLKIGDTQSVVTQAYPDKVFTGKISEIAPSADTNSRVFDVKIDIDNKENLLKVGMIASLRLPKGAGSDVQGPLLPLSAVVRSQADKNGYAVFVLQSDADKTIAKLTDVELGDVHGNKIIVLGGLDDKARVVINGASFLRDGQQVAVIP
ncbi:efflux RND transporter periplasmic adaptor subunit [Sneathiella sp. CAU 1612]|uniref:Efflux RND transporter periplasmic adaptor subunit n=1 Tax=Sneathiella sedimenti TaxID=2816034 RepID=A0ABS3F0U8_9PROT|nr:efflux RND transporter periplasmic adaptor subunit [Sneathiella sedimenti]MBO0332135.1 efflux RND transporter periplasmic adaptor subunit [Sneathiella sedimenti]